ncbi:hypothetical protein [Actinoplanes sp. DH11]|uniref:hypothetical protein n=1 Tax=Actinoplanes sp. DH11 TaxID=2857011 RepID=UPI001E56B020|nr:hypothetical protein [Actinoplanes sp. DH11]
MSAKHRYATTSALFAAGYLAVAYTAAGPLSMSPIMLPALAVGALWLLAQAGYGRFRLDVIMLTTAAAVAATLNGAGFLLALTYAVVAAIPAVLFAMAMNRLLPGWWLGHGDRFRARGFVFGRLATASALAAVANAVLLAVVDADTASAGAVFHAARDTLLVMLMVWAARSYRLSKEPRRGGLSVVR